MNERSVAGFLHALRRLANQLNLYPAGHPLMAEAVRSVDLSIDDLAGLDREVVLTVLGDALYYNRAVLPHTSLEFNGLIRQMQHRGVDSITLLPPVSQADIYDLAAFISAMSDDLPADGTVRLNEHMFSASDLEQAPLSKLRTSYGRSLDALRLVSGSMAAHGSFEMGSVVDAVEGLFEHSVSQAGASLLLATVKSHDEYTFFHSVNTCILALAAGRRLGVAREELVPIGVGAALHDIGKVAVSTKVLHHPGRLDDEQWSEIRIHPQEGAIAILAAGGPGHEIAATVAFEHHARFDGTGYPAVTRDGRPHPFSRLVSVSDTYDAITTRRSYRRAETPNRALSVLVNGAGSMYDPDFVGAFIDLMGIHPPGSILELAGGELALVVAAQDDEHEPLRCLLVKDADGNLIEAEPIEVDPSKIVRHVLAQQAEIDPAAYLELAALETD